MTGPNTGSPFSWLSDVDEDETGASKTRLNADFQTWEPPVPAGSVHRRLGRSSGGLMEPWESADKDNSDRSMRYDSKRKNDRPTIRLGATSWLAEISSLIAAIFCLIAIVVILTVYNNQKQPQWSAGETLNLSTLIAVLATILRSLLTGVVEAGKSHSVLASKRQKI